MRTTDEAQDQASHVVAIRCRPELLALIERAAASEGLSKADIVRRATLQALRAAPGGGNQLTKGVA